MSGESYTIVKGYRIFTGSPTGESTEAPSVFDLLDWLMARGLSESAARDIIKKIDFSGQMVVNVP
jgi:hypothetical protein